MIRCLARGSLATLVLALAGCPAPGDEFGIAVPGKDDETGDVDTETGETGDADTDTDTDTDSDTDTGDKNYNFDDAGDLVASEADETPFGLSLADESGDSNQDQQFFAILVNPTESDQSYNLRYIQDSDVSARQRREGGSRAKIGKVDVQQVIHRPIVPRRDALEVDDIGSLVDIFRVRVNVTDEEWEEQDATLWALGEHIAIWVDNEVPIDWDYDCDGVVDEAHEYAAYDFDNCDLVTVADIFDLNIYPNVTALFGEPSDQDGDGRVDLFLTPELNRMPVTSDDEDEQSAVLESYAEPAVDLAAYDFKTNEGSDEREVIYAYAPDPGGRFHIGSPVATSEYTSYALSAEIARSLVSLISYNQHIIVNEGTTVEEDWLNDVLGTLAADRCGFGAPFHDDAWDYLDAPHNSPLLAEGERGSLRPTTKGAQYLFGLWLWDWAEANTSDRNAFLAKILATTSVGIEGVEGALKEYAVDTDTSFDDLVAGWQLAALATGATDSSGATLVSDASFVPYSDAEFLSSPPASRDSLYGANGYQRGIWLRGENLAYVDGQTDFPYLEADSEVLLGGTDPFHFDPAFAFDGWIAADYGAQVVRLNGIPYVAAGLELQFKGDGFLATVVRWNDPVTPDYAVEQIFSPTDADSVSLPSLPDDGTEIYGIGELSSAVEVEVKITADDVESADVLDTDRWRLDLTDRPAGEVVYLQAWLDRRFDEDGDSQPSDAWIAIAPEEYVPEPTFDGTHASDVCSGDIDFAFPDSFLEHLYYQVMLSGTMGSESALTDACGVTQAAAPDCADDYDGDWVTDADEPLPETFYDQILVQQCTSLGGSIPSGVSPYSTDWLDVDEIDEDDDVTYYRKLNTGGLAGTEGEEGFISVELVGGESYLIIVGSAGDSGIYELSMRQILK